MTIRKKILLIEDNADDEALTLEAFRRHNVNIEIFVVRDGQEALDYLFSNGLYIDRDTSDMPHLILLDLHLPKIDGLEVLKRLRNNDATRRLPVTVLTTSSLESDMIQSYDNGANSYLNKPVDYDEFTDVIKMIDNYWLQLNRVIHA